MFSAKGAAFISAWGNAPGIVVEKISSALKARFSCTPDMIRAFSARFFNILFLGRCPRLKVSRALGTERVRGRRPTMLGGLILGVFVVGRRRLTPVLLLREPRVDVLGETGGRRKEVPPLRRDRRT